jgi:hypothetical protein
LPYCFGLIAIQSPRSLVRIDMMAFFNVRSG